MEIRGIRMNEKQERCSCWSVLSGGAVRLAGRVELLRMGSISRFGRSIGQAIHPIDRISFLVVDDFGLYPTPFYMGVSGLLASGGIKVCFPEV